MIASVSGRVAAIGPEVVVLEVGGASSVGFTVRCVPATLAGLRVGEQARLATSLVVREESLTLYGFDDDAQRTVFELLQTASGVGPRLAQAALAVHSPSELARAIVQADIAALTAVPGIGKKGAQRLVLELAERMATLATVNPQSSEVASGLSSSATSDEPLWRQQVREGLMALGWSSKLAEDATGRVAKQWAEQARTSGESEAGVAQPPPNVAVLLKEAISILGRTR